MATAMRLLLCEYASVHADGTCSIVRGGLESLTPGLLPVALAPWLFLELRLESLPRRREHMVRVQVHAPSGLLTEQTHPFTLARVDDPRGTVRFAMVLGLEIQERGAHTIRATVDGGPTGELVLLIGATPAQAAAEQTGALRVAN